MYYNYHARIAQLLEGGHLTEYKYLDEYNKISPCLLLFFDNHRPMPVREKHFDRYMELVNKYYPGRFITKSPQ